RPQALIERLRPGPARDIPEADAAVIAPGDHRPAIRRENNGAGLIGVSSQDIALAKGSRVPQPDGTVTGGGDEGPAIGRECKRLDPTPVSLESADRPPGRPRAGAHRPEPDDTIETARSQGRAVRSEGQAAHRAGGIAREE